MPSLYLHTNPGLATVAHHLSHLYLVCLHLGCRSWSWGVACCPVFTCHKGLLGESRLPNKVYALLVLVEQYSQLIEQCWGEASNKFRDRFCIQW